MTFPPIEFLTTILVSTICIFFAFVVFVKNPKSLSNILFSLFNLDIAFWSVANFLSLNSSLDDRLFWMRIVMFFVTPQIFLLFLFIHTFPSPKINLSKKFLISGSLATTVLMVLSLTSLIFNNFTFVHNNQVPVPGAMMPIFFAFVVILFISSIFQIINQTFNRKGIEGWQWRSISSGFFLMISLDVLLLFILPVIFQNSMFVPFAPVFVIPFIFGTLNAILRYQSFELKIIFRKSLINGMLLSIVLALHLYLLLFVEEFLRGRFGFSSYVSSAMVVVIVGFSFPFLQRLCYRVVNRFFQSEEWDFSEKVDLIRSSLVNLKFLQDFAEEKVKELEQRFQVSGVIFLLRDHRLQSTLSVYPSVGEIVLDDYDPFILCLLGLRGKVLDAEAFERKWALAPKKENQDFGKLHKFFKKHNVALAVGFGPENSLAGGIVIPHGPNGLKFSNRVAFESFAREVYSDLKALLRAQENVWADRMGQSDVSFD